MKQIGLIQIGLGLIGQTAIAQIMQQRSRWEHEHGLQLVHRAMIDSSGGVACQDVRGYTDHTLMSAVAGRRGGQQIRDFAAGLGLTPRDQADAIELATECGACILIDTAIGSDTAGLTASGLAQGHAVVLSNKAPLALPLQDERGKTLWSQTGYSGRLRYETTCGAGLPVISTIRSLLDSGDSVLEIIGVLSGTFGAIFSDVDGGISFSCAVRNAKELSYTEPDPRDDLSGLDVARKALILARTIGQKVDLGDVEIESLVPPELAGGSVDDFLNGIAAADDSIRQRTDEARSNGSRLKYVASLKPDSRISVGLRPIPVDTVLGSLRGPENVVTIRTKRYDAYPINIAGPGAGAAVTAAGVVADVLEVAKLIGARN
jgi:homoserine dehydrogenase